MPRTHQSLPRLFVDAPMRAGSILAPDKSQSNYLGNVLRMRTGDELVVFNGIEGAWRAAITRSGGKALELTVCELVAPQTPPSDLWYGFAPLKTGRLDYMVQKATEMGAGIIQPVITRHTQKTRLKPDRLRANVVEAAEQCEVLSLPGIAEEIPLPRLIASWSEQQPARMLVFADEGEASASPMEALQGLAGRRIGLLIGPEGGFSNEERALLRQQEFVIPISLGPRILRADTAAVAALAVIQSIIGDWR